MPFFQDWLELASQVALAATSLCLQWSCSFPWLDCHDGFTSAADDGGWCPWSRTEGVFPVRPYTDDPDTQRNPLLRANV